jgi:hypothetical protein
VTRTAGDEEELPRSRLKKLHPRDQATVAERTGERESRGSA